MLCCLPRQTQNRLRNPYQLRLCILQRFYVRPASWLPPQPPKWHKTDKRAGQLKDRSPTRTVDPTVAVASSPEEVGPRRCRPPRKPPHSLNGLHVISRALNIRRPIGVSKIYVSNPTGSRA